MSQSFKRKIGNFFYFVQKKTDICHIGNSFIKNELTLFKLSNVTFLFKMIVNFSFV